MVFDKMFRFKIEDGTSDKPLKFGCDTDHGCLLVVLICLFACLSVSRITQKVMNGFR